MSDYLITDVMSEWCSLIPAILDISVSVYILIGTTVNLIYKMPYLLIHILFLTSKAYT